MMVWIMGFFSSRIKLDPSSQVYSCCDEMDDLFKSVDFSKTADSLVIVSAKDGISVFFKYCPFCGVKIRTINGTMEECCINVKE